MTRLFQVPLEIGNRVIVCDAAGKFYVKQKKRKMKTGICVATQCELPNFGNDLPAHESP